MLLTFHWSRNIPRSTIQISRSQALSPPRLTCVPAGTFSKVQLYEVVITTASLGVWRSTVLSPPLPGGADKENSPLPKNWRVRLFAVESFAVCALAFSHLFCSFCFHSWSYCHETQGQGRQCGAGSPNEGNQSTRPHSHLPQLNPCLWLGHPRGNLDNPCNVPSRQPTQIHPHQRPPAMNSDDFLNWSLGS